MPITDHFALASCTAIKILRGERQRRELDFDDLLASIKRNGVLVPIILRKNPDPEPPFILIAGERRLAASLHLGLESIPYRLFEDLDPLEHEIVELEENVKREDLEWQDKVRTYGLLHDAYKRREPEWTLGETAEMLSISSAHLSKFYLIWGSFGDPTVLACGTYNEAYNLILRRERRASASALEELLAPTEEKEDAKELDATDDFQTHSNSSDADGIDSNAAGIRTSAPRSPPSPPLPVVQCLDFIEWAKDYSGPRFNLIHCDFPYGIGLFSSNGKRAGAERSQMGHDDSTEYPDTPELYQSLVLALCENLERIASQSAHLMFWFSNKWEIESWTRDAFRRLAPSVRFARFPLIWHKTDNAGIASAPTYEPRHVYETCLLGIRGNRSIVRVVSDVYGAPSERSERTHVSQKPIGMLKHFMGMLVDEHTRLLDPTCGSGSALIAADALGAKAVVGFELDPERADGANKAIELERRKRKAFEEFGG